MSFSFAFKHTYTPFFKQKTFSVPLQTDFFYKCFKTPFNWPRFLGFNVETVEYKNVSFTMWDVGGQKKIRALWRYYYENTQGTLNLKPKNGIDFLNKNDAIFFYFLLHF